MSSSIRDVFYQALFSAVNEALDLADASGRVEVPKIMALIDEHMAQIKEPLTRALEEVIQDTLEFTPDEAPQDSGTSSETLALLQGALVLIEEATDKALADPYGANSYIADIKDILNEVYVSQVEEDEA